MTAQIVLINQAGIAVASDSLTSSMGGHGDFVRKATPGAQKVYSLPKQHDIVVVHSGQVYLGNVQYQLLVNEWARSLRDKGPYERLDQYVESFDHFVSHWRTLDLNDISQINRVVRPEIAELWEFAKRVKPEMLDPEASAAKGFDIFKAFNDESEAEILEMINLYAEHFMRLDTYEDLSLERAIKIINASDYSPVSDFKYYFDQEEISSDLETAVLLFAAERIRRFETRNTTLNFVGFGSTEPIGGVIELKVEAFHSDRLRFEQAPRRPEINKHADVIFPIAQTSATDQFVLGLDGPFQSNILNLVETCLSDLADPNSDEGREFLKKFDEGITRLKDGHRREVYGTLSILGINALNSLARFLIESQSFNSAAVDDQTSVGGEIESLVITRANGVEWTRTLSGSRAHVFG